MPFHIPLDEALQERSGAERLRLHNYDGAEDLRDGIAALSVEEIVEILYAMLPLEARVKFAQLWKLKQGD